MNILYKDTVAVFDDSFQPIGIVWIDEGGWIKIPVPHVKMKKLRHELILTITGPDDAKSAVENCIRQGAVAAALAALGTAFIGVGIGATGAALAAFQSQFIACAGQQLDIRIDDHSHWIEWVT